MQKQWKDTLISSIVQFLSVLQMNTEKQAGFMKSLLLTFFSNSIYNTVRQLKEHLQEAEA